jgi:hypothetical protein
MRHPKIRFHIPAWAAIVYITTSVCLIPWTLYLYDTLRAHHVVRHWDVIWLGVDAALAVCLLATGVTALKKSLWVVMAATLTGGLLLMDAWFDVMSARPGPELVQAVFAALLLELPLAAASFYLAHLTLKQAYGNRR